MKKVAFPVGAKRRRKDYFVQGWKPRRIYADFIMADTNYKRSVFDLCSQHAKKTDWADFVPAMQGKVMRFEVVDEDEWEQRLNAMFA